MPRPSRELYWSAILADFRRSGLTHVEFCRRRRISIHAFRSWLYRRPPDLRPTSGDAQGAPPVPTPAPSATPQFLPVCIRPQPVPGLTSPHDSRSAPALELVLTDDRRIRIPPGFDPATLRQLLDTLEGQP